MFQLRKQSGVMGPYLIVGVTCRHGIGKAILTQKLQPESESHSSRLLKAIISMEFAAIRAQLEHVLCAIVSTI